MSRVANPLGEITKIQLFSGRPLKICGTEIQWQPLKLGGFSVEWLQLKFTTTTIGSWLDLQHWSHLDH